MVRGDLGLPAARVLRARGDARRPPSVARVGLTTPKSGRTLCPRRRTQRTDMKRLLILTLSLALAVGLVSAPSLAVAGGHHHRGFHGGAVFVGRPFFPHHHFFHRHFFFGSGFVGPFVPFGVVAAPVVVYSSPAVVYTPPPVVYAPPVAYAPPPVASYSSPAPAPAPPPMPTVIQYPHGRYELRGDGMTTPYTWVWIPNPPPPPAPPATPPAEPQTGPMPSPTRGQLYSWTDGQGVTIWTNRADKTPEGARAQAKRLQAAGI